jgi:Mg2+/citrate symporter
MKQKSLLAFASFAAVLTALNAFCALVPPYAPANWVYVLGAGIGLWLTNDVLKERRKRIADKEKRAEKRSQRSET